MEKVQTMALERQKPLPSLVRQSATYKLVVPEKVEEKIRYLIRKFPHTEWSGILFYRHTGTFEHDDLVVTCEDIYPMDLGTSGFTEFRMTPEVTNYIANNIDLFDCEVGIIHSHHVLTAFFSSTDNLTLNEGGNDTNCFLSLIVDTRGQYVARITRKVHLRKETVTKNIDAGYEFFGEGTVKVPCVGEERQDVEEDVIEYYDLEVERHEVPNPLAALDERFDDIERKKGEKAKPLSTPQPKTDHSDYSGYKGCDGHDFYDLAHPWEARKKKVQEQFLFDDDTMEAMNVVPEYKPDKALIHEMVCRMVSCSLILNVDKFDLRQWVTRHMNNVYEKIFPDGAAHDEWVEFIVPFFVYHCIDKTAPEGLDDESYYSAIANAMIEELSPYDDAAYPYIRDYIGELTTIIV